MILEDYLPRFIAYDEVTKIIWGIGNSESAAKANGKEFLSSWNKAWDESKKIEFKLIESSQRLYKHLLYRGGNFSGWEINSKNIADFNSNWNYDTTLEEFIEGKV